jgi:hypothetical protein
MPLRPVIIAINHVVRAVGRRHALPGDTGAIQDTAALSRPREEKGYLMKVKKLAAAVAIAVPVAAALVGTAQPASAMPALPMRCSADLCMDVLGVNGNVATILMWAYSYDFHGHFELQMPNHRVANSPTNRWWNAGQSGYTFANWNGGVGQWCGTEWAQVIPGVYSKIGAICLHA